MNKNLPPMAFRDRCTVAVECLPNALYRTMLADLLDEMLAAIERQSVPADCDVRKIMLAVVPGEDGMGHEVYAKNISEVEAKLSEMGQRLEEWELGIRRFAAAPQPQPVQGVEHCLWARNGNSRCPVPQAAQQLTPEWYARWIRNNYQDRPNIATLCEELTKAAHGITKGTT